MIERTYLRRVTGNSNWWKAKKYRRETAEALFEYRARGWRLVAIRRLATAGVDTRIFSEYTLVRERAGADACAAPGEAHPPELLHPGLAYIAVQDDPGSCRDRQPKAGLPQFFQP
jgi:hypothetical protein